MMDDDDDGDDDGDDADDGDDDNDDDADDDDDDDGDKCPQRNANSQRGIGEMGGWHTLPPRRCHPPVPNLNY